MMRHTIFGITMIFLSLGFILANPARAVNYSCVPLEVAVLDNRVHVLCAAPNPGTRGGSYPEDKGNQIMYFAVPLSDKDWSNRFIQIANIAITSGRPIIFSYNSGDYSGEAFGCSRNNCRTPWAYTILKTAYVPLVSDSSANIQLDMPKGWSIFSLPVMPQSPLASNVFPDAIVIYSFSKDSGYLRVKGNEELEAGKGYWILLPEAKNYAITGDSVEEYSLSVENGWTMIGSCSCPSAPMVNTGSITVIYRFEKGSGYVRVLPSEVLESGEGYWIYFTGIPKNTDLLVKCKD